MENSIDFATYTQWLGIATIGFLLLTILAFVLGWGVRFRLVGVTSFMGVITASVFALGLGLFARTAIPGAVRYTLVYDNAANQTVVAVAPDVTESEVENTLRQAASDLFSYGRMGPGENKLTVRVRTVVHPKPGISTPLYLGEAKQPLSSRDSDKIELKLFAENFAQLP